MTSHITANQSTMHLRTRFLRAVALWTIVLLILPCRGIAASEPVGSGRETAGWHVMRPGENLETVADRYMQSPSRRDELARLNPELETPEAGERVLVKLPVGLPSKSALVGHMAGRVDAQPTPVDWNRSRRFDLLAAGDGVRTFSSASVEVFFADTSRLLLTEDSLVFLRDSQRQTEVVPAGEIEVIEGQVDLKSRVLPKANLKTVEILLGEARVTSRPGPSGDVDARARKTAQGDGQVMVYRGVSRIAAAGTTVEVQAGEGSVVPAAGPPSAPERLLAAPILEAPLQGAVIPEGPRDFRWQPVGGAASYTFELCRDLDCSLLVEREVGLRGTNLRLPRIGRGAYFWRVTAMAASRLDGYPAAATSFRVERSKEAQPAPFDPAAQGSATIAGSVRSRPEAIQLPGALIKIVELGRAVRTTGDGRFQLADLPPGSYSLEAHLPGFVVAEQAHISALAGQTSTVTFFLDAAPLTRDEIVVRPSRVSLMSANPASSFALDRDEILALPHLGDDIFRALPLLPGAASSDISAQFHVRGGRRDEVQVRLDGQEIYGAYHLRDFDNALSIIAPSALGGVDLTTGGFAASLGDRMGGVLSMQTLPLTGERRTLLGLSPLTLQGGASGAFPGEKGAWMAVARRGSVDLVDKLVGPEKPVFWDVMAKTTFDLGERQNLSLHALYSQDQLRFSDVEGVEFKNRDTDHDSTYLWLNHQTLLTSRLFVDSLASWSDVNSQRDALEVDEEQQFEVRDRRSFDVAEVRQDWTLGAGSGSENLLSWGVGVRRFDAPVDYFSFRNYGTPIVLIRAEPREGAIRLVDRFTDTHWSAYISDRLHLGDHFTAELGGRFDSHSLGREAFGSPRVNVAYSLGGSTVLRAGWGVFHQSHRPYELQVEDGETTFAEAEKGEHSLIGFEHLFQEGSGFPGIALRVEAYRREIDNPRRFFDNLFEPFNTFPELEPDRVRLEAERRLSQGVEVFLLGPTGRRVGWWGNYTWARAEDRMEGRWVPRKVDQTHTLNLNVAFPVGRNWHLNVAFRAHTGWPTTALDLLRIEAPPEEDGDDALGEDPEDDAGEGPQAEGDVELVPVLGPLNGERLSFYHRLDLRASRKLPVRRGTLTLFVDVQNLYNQKNQSGFDYGIDEDAGELQRVVEHWPGIFPTVGLSWEF